MQIADIEKYFQDFSITTGVVRYNDLCYLLSTKDEYAKDKIPHTRIYEFDRGKLGAVDLPWMACSATVCNQPEERFIAIGEVGFVQVMGGGQIQEETPIQDGDYSPDSRGPLREVRGIAKGHAYAVGTARQVYKRLNPNHWIRFDQSIQSRNLSVIDASLESIDGFSEDDIYAVGWDGEIWHFNGTMWFPVESPTNLALYKVRCAPDGLVYACGQSGTLLRGRSNSWKSVQHDSTLEDLWGLEWFNDRLYIASLGQIYELSGDTLQTIDFGDEPPPASCYHLSAADGIMWSVGAKNVVQFDGNLWTTVL